MRARSIGSPEVGAAAGTGASAGTVAAAGGYEGGSSSFLQAPTATKNATATSPFTQPGRVDMTVMDTTREADRRRASHRSRRPILGRPRPKDEARRTRACAGRLAGA